MDKRILAGLLTILVLLGGFTYYLSSTASYVYANKNANKASQIAEIIVERVSDRINYILSLADKYGIKIPENMTTRIKLARAMLQNASNYIDIEPTKAIRLAILASIAFSPVAKYIMKNLPENVIAEMRGEAIQNAILVKLKIIDRFNNTISKLKNMSIPVPQSVIEKLDNAKSLLLNAENMLNSNNYDIKKVANSVAKASTLIAEATRELYRGIHKIWVKASLVDRSICMLSGISMKIGIALNKSIELLEGGNVDEAKNIITKLDNGVENILNYLDNAIKFAGKHKWKGNFTNTLITLRDSLNKVDQYLKDALDSLNNNDSLTAISDLESALSLLKNTYIKIAPIFKGVYVEIGVMGKYMRNFEKNLRERIGRIALHKMAGLTFLIARSSERLHIAYQLYKKGVISREKMLSMLDSTEKILNNILNKLKELPHQPKILIDKITQLINWIESVKAEISS